MKENIPNMLAFLVSREATLLYLYMLMHAKDDGTCESCIRRATECGLVRDEWKTALDELEDAKLISVFEVPTPMVEFSNGAVIYGTRWDCRFTQYEPPKSIGRLSAESWGRLRSEVFERDDYTCGYCGSRGKAMECDHVIPIAKGGTNELGNLLTACRSCNRKKRDKMLEEWRNG